MSKAKVEACHPTEVALTRGDLQVIRQGKVCDMDADHVRQVLDKYIPQEAYDYLTVKRIDKLLADYPENTIYYSYRRGKKHGK